MKLVKSFTKEIQCDIEKNILCKNEKKQNLHETVPVVCVTIKVALHKLHVDNKVIVCYIKINADKNAN